MKIYNINRVYREQAPVAEEGSHGGAAAPAEPEAPELDAEPDEGQDTIPEEVSLWDRLSHEIDEPDEDEEEVIEDSPRDPTPEKPAEKPAPTEEEPAAETTAPEPTAADTAVPTEPEVQPTIEPEPTPRKSAEEVQAEVTARRQSIEAGLTDRFKLSEDEALQLVTNPESVFPKLQARMFTDMWLHVEALIDQRLPTVIENTTRSMKVREEKVNNFFQAWPKLDRVKHGRQVAQIAQIYSQVNPAATDEEVIKNVGIQVMLANGITPDGISETPPDTPETPVTPHRPSAVHSATQPQTRSSDNLYEQLSYDLEDDEG